MKTLSKLLFISLLLTCVGHAFSATPSFKDLATTNTGSYVTTTSFSSPNFLTQGDVLWGRLTVSLVLGTNTIAGGYSSVTIASPTNDATQVFIRLTSPALFFGTKWLLLENNNSATAWTLKNGQANVGSGSVLLTGGDFVANTPQQAILLEWNSANWTEVGRRTLGGNTNLQDLIWANIAGVIQPNGTGPNTNDIQIYPLGGILIGGSNALSSWGNGMVSGESLIAIHDVSKGQPNGVEIYGQTQTNPSQTNNSSFDLFANTNSSQLVLVNKTNGASTTVTLSNANGQPELFFYKNGQYLTQLRPGTSDGFAPYTLDTSVFHTNGPTPLLKIGNAGTNIFQVFPDGGIITGSSTTNFYGGAIGNGETLVSFRDSSRGDTLPNYVFIGGGSSITNYGLLSINADHTLSQIWLQIFTNNVSDMLLQSIVTPGNAYIGLKVGPSFVEKFKLSPTEADGSIGYLFDSSITHTFPYQFFANNGTKTLAIPATNGVAGQVLMKGTGGTNDYWGTVTPGTTINPTDGYIPVRGSATTFTNSPWYVISSRSLGFGTNIFLREGSTLFAIGDWAGENYSSGDITAVGNRALRNWIGPGTATALGSDALQVATTGNSLVAIGASAMANANGSFYDTGVGAGGVLNGSTSSEGNTALGYGAGLSVTTAQSNTFLGISADTTLGTAHNSTAIGAGATIATHNEIVLGNSQVTVVRPGASNVTSLGSSTRPFKDLYLQTNSLYLGTNVITDNGSALIRNGVAVGNSGTVTSVGLATPSIFGATNTPVTSSGTLGFTNVFQTANTVWAGPTSGGVAGPTFRALVAADIPSGVGFAALEVQTNNVRVGLQTNINMNVTANLLRYATNNSTSNKIDLLLDTVQGIQTTSSPIFAGGNYSSTLKVGTNTAIQATNILEVVSTIAGQNPAFMVHTNGSTYVTKGLAIGTVAAGVAGTLTMQGNAIVGGNASIALTASPLAPLEIGPSTGVAKDHLTLGANGPNIGGNAYYASGWKYIATGAAEIFTMDTTGVGDPAFLVAASGTAGSAITWKTPFMIINASAADNTLILKAGNVISQGLITATNGFASYRSNLLASVAISVGASPFNWTNTTANTASPAMDIDVSIDGVSVTGTTALNGQVEYNSIGQNYHHVHPGEWITITYTLGSPTARWKPH